MKRGLFIFFCLVCFILFIVGHVSAKKGKIRIGKIQIIPSITVRAVHDDNIYLASGTNDNTERKVSDWINHISPAIALTYSMNERGSITIGYQGNLAYYDKNDLNDWKSHKGLSNIDYKAPGGFILGLNDVYINTGDPYGSDNQYKLGVAQTKRWSNNLSTKLGYDFGNKLIILGYFNYYKQDYKKIEDYSQDFDSPEYGAGFKYRLLPKTSMFLRYHYGERDYYTHVAGTDESNDSDLSWQRINTGLAWDPTAKMKGEMNFGYTWEEYKNPFDANGNRFYDKQTWIADTSLLFNATPSTTLNFKLSRSYRELGSNTNQYFSDTGFGLCLYQKLSQKFTMSAGGVYSINEYNSIRDDDQIKANIGIGYRVQDWLNANIGYNYSKRDSNINSNDYVDHQYWLTIKGGY